MLRQVDTNTEMLDELVRWIRLPEYFSHQAHGHLHACLRVVAGGKRIPRSLPPLRTEPIHYCLRRSPSAIVGTAHYRKFSYLHALCLSLARTCRIRQMLSRLPVRFATITWHEGTSRISSSKREQD